MIAGHPLSRVWHCRLILMGDKYINYALAQILIPFNRVDYKPIWIGLGQIGFYLLAIVAFSFYVRKRIGHKTWRLIHFISFAVYVLALLHGLFSGTDSPADWATTFYWISWYQFAFPDCLSHSGIGFPA